MNAHNTITAAYPMDDGMELRIIRTAYGHSVTLVDIDSGLTANVYRRAIAAEAEAVAFAESLLGKKAAA